MTLEELEKKINPMGCPSFEAVASTGEGVFPTLKALASLVLESINREKQGGLGGEAQPAAAVAAAAAAPRSVPAAAPGAAAAPRSVPSAPARPAAPAQPRSMPKPKPQPAQRVRPAAAQKQQPAAARKAEPMGRPAGRPSGKVKIKERQDASRVMLWVLILAVILGAGAFVAWKFNLV